MSNSNITSTEESSVNIREALLKYLIHWKWFLLSLVLFLFAAKIYLRYSIPTYKASTTILIKGEDLGGVPSELAAFNDLGLISGGKNNLDDEIEILKSRSLIGKTVASGKFNVIYRQEGTIKSGETYLEKPIQVNFNTNHKDFYKMDTTLVVKVLSPEKFILFNSERNEVGQYRFGQVIKSKKLGDYSISVDKDNLKNMQTNVIIQLSSLNSAIDGFKGAITISTLSKFSNVLEITYTNPVKEKAEDFLNQLVAIYNNDAIIDKNMVSEKTANFINDRLAIITNELDGVEKQVESYKKQNKITDLPTEAELYLRNASESNKSQVSVETQLKIVEMMIDFMNNNKDSDIIPSNLIPDDNSSAEFIAQYNNLVIERNRVLKSSTPKNPAVIRVNDRIKALKSNISESLNKLKSSLSVQSNEVENQGGIISGRIAKIPKQEREFRGIFRQQQIKEELYLYLFKKREETAISLAATAPLSKVVDEAYSTGAPVSPKRELIYLVCLILGLLAPFSIIYIINLLDTKVKNRHDIETHLSVPFIGDVPHSDDNNEIIQSSSRTSSAEAIRIVRTNLEFILNNVDGHKAKTIFLTSTLPKEGKTFIAINLAATIAISGKKVLLIGMDVRNPKLEEYVKLPSRGLTNYLSANNVDIHDFIVKQKDYENFDILPAGVIPPNPAELLMSKKVESMFEQLKSEYDYIVVDTAPVSLVTDTLLISKNADAFVYVVRANYLEKSLLKTPETLYKEKKLPNMCVLLNDTDTTNGYGYGYGQEVIKKPWYKKMFGFITIFG